MRGPSSSTPRGCALEVLGGVLQKGKFATQELDRVLSLGKISLQDRALVTQLVYGVLRQKGFLDGVLSGKIDFRKTSPFLCNILRIGIYQILLLDKIPDHAAIFESVQSAKKNLGPIMGNLVNAVLRAVQKDRDKILSHHREILASLQEGGLPFENGQEISAHLSLPLWLWKRWAVRYGTLEAARLALVLNRTPALFLRANLQMISPEDLLNQIENRGIEGRPIEGTPAIQIEASRGKELGDFFSGGLASIQDINSYRILTSLFEAKGKSVLDVCAGHGGKATALMESWGREGEIWVYDKSSLKIKELNENFKRLHLNSPRVLDPEREGHRQWDRILIDAPCSGLGTLRRKPEIKWRIQEADLREFSKEQKEILERWAPRVKVGGQIHYSVCSLEPEEGERLLRDFVHDHPSWELTEHRYLDPRVSEGDGFFLGRMLRKS